jgi:hypothetical protein
VESENPDVARAVGCLQALLTNLGRVPTLDFMLILKAWCGEMHVAACVCMDECPAAGTDACKCGGESSYDPDCMILRIRLEETLTPALEAAGG